MADFLTLAEADDHLRLDLLESGDEREDDLQAKIDQAEQIVLDYLKVDGAEWSGDTLPRPIRAAMLLTLSALWEDREGTGDGDYLRPDGAVTRLLHRFRDPAMA